jgi:hypothetical protein
MMVTYRGFLGQGRKFSRMNIAATSMMMMTKEENGLSRRNASADTGSASCRVAPREGV